MTPPRRSRSAFLLKLGLAALLAALADRLFFAHAPGATAGVFALAWIAGLVAVRPGLLKEPRAAFAIAAAAMLALAMIDRPTLLGWLLFGGAVTVAAMSARVAHGEPVWRWTQRLVFQAVVGVAAPVLDLLRVQKARRGQPAPSSARLLRTAALPVLGGAVFLGLFASANPLIAHALATLRPPLLSPEIVGRSIFWTLVLIGVGATLRPRWRRRLLVLPSLGAGRIPGVNARSVVLSLLLFNALFAVQNGLDLVFLWSGAPLPDGVTLADYAHRGAYALVATALLAGAFVLVALRPGSETAARPLARRLVMLWVGQNLFLVASSLLRTLDYVEAYALTRFRLAAMIWMGLVAAGLVLICWRVLRDRSAHWLIDANAWAALAVLAAVSVVDLGAVAAAWNVRHAREVDGTGAALDLCYLDRLGPRAVVSLAELETRVRDPGLKARATAARSAIQRDMQARQAHWRGWTWRDARRLARVERLVGGPSPAGLASYSCENRVAARLTSGTGD